jgi:superfamily II DNA/RNA helicase
MDEFRTGKIPLLVASDVAARGLDIKGITHVFNLDMPEKSQDYLHRAGRTGRAGASGIVISLATPREIQLIKDYEKFFKLDIIAKEMYMGRIMDFKPRRGIVRKPLKNRPLIKEDKK